VTATSAANVIAVDVDALVDRDRLADVIATTCLCAPVVRAHANQSRRASRTGVADDSSRGG
jgi:hypothetical protein